MTILWTVLLALGYALQAFGQCVQCLRNAQQQTAEQARALNSGILFLLLPAFVAIGGVVWMAWRKRGS